MSQSKRIKRHLMDGGTITALEALKWFGCLRLGSRIFDLRKGGLDVKTKMVIRNGKRVAEYSL